MALIEAGEAVEGVTFRAGFSLGFMAGDENAKSGISSFPFFAEPQPLSVSAGGVKSKRWNVIVPFPDSPRGNFAAGRAAVAAGSESFPGRS